MKKLMSVFCILLTLNGCCRGYSEGDRSGTIVKFSYKGMVCKTYEGSMNLGGTVGSENGVVPSTWHFTVTNPALIGPFQDAVASGKRVTVHYVEWAVAPPCSSDSGYEATSIK